MGDSKEVRVEYRLFRAVRSGSGAPHNSDWRVAGSHVQGLPMYLDLNHSSLSSYVFKLAHQALLFLTDFLKPDGPWKDW